MKLDNNRSRRIRSYVSCECLVRYHKRSGVLLAVQIERIGDQIVEISGQYGIAKTAILRVRHDLREGRISVTRHPSGTDSLNFALPICRKWVTSLEHIGIA